MKSLSKEHAAAVAEGARHHERTKTYSGSLMRPHVPYLEQLIRRRLITSALDYGCGKGVQYEWRDPTAGNRTVEERFGFKVFKYDPCYPPFATPPGPVRFDLVICTHTLSLVPLADLDTVIERLFGYATKAVFIAEKIGDRKKAEVEDPTNRPIGWTVQQWLDRLAPFADHYRRTDAIFSSRERVGDATITTRHRRERSPLGGGRWISEVAGPLV